MQTGLHFRLDSIRPSIAVGDFNNDSRLDIVVINVYDNSMSVLLGYGNGSFVNHSTYVNGDIFWAVAVSDFNNDMRLDIVITAPDNNYVGVLLGYGNGSFANQTIYTTVDSPSPVAVGDLNNDTRLDIIVVDSTGNEMSVLLGFGNGSFANQTTYTTGSFPNYIAIADFNNDRRVDIIVTNSDSNNVGVFIGYGDGTFAHQVTYSTGASPYSVAVGNFNKDTRLDFVVCNFNDDNLNVFLGYPNELFQNKTTLKTGNGSQPRSFVIDDFNNDNRMDIVIANSGTHNIGIFLGHGNISFTNQVTYSTGEYSFPYSVAAGDLNNDNRLDIVVANYGSDNIGIFLGYGNGSFANQTTYFLPLKSSPYSVAIADFNNDMILDIIVTNIARNNLVLWLGRGNSTFAPLILLPLGYGSRPFLIVVSDLNNDKKLDFAVANYGSDSLTVFLQTC